MATVLKTVVAERSPGVRIPLPPPEPAIQRTLRGGAGVVDRGRLLSGCRAKNSTQGSNPCLPADMPPWLSLDRAFGCGPKGRRFESCRGYLEPIRKTVQAASLCRLYRRIGMRRLRFSDRHLVVNPRHPCLLPPASCLLPPASCLLPPASCFLLSVPCQSTLIRVQYSPVWATHSLKRFWHVRLGWPE